MMKGLEMPTSTIVLIALAILVLVVLSSFFIGGSGRQMSTAEAQRIFYEDCQGLCTTDSEENYVRAYDLLSENADFIAACIQLGHGTSDFPNRCLERCGCDMSVVRERVGSKMNDIRQRLDTAV